MESASHSEVSKKRRRWGCLRILLCLFGVCLIAPIVAFFIWTTWHGYQVDQMVKEIRARGEPITLEELEKSITIPAGERDTTAIWKRGFEPLETLEYGLSAESIPFVGNVKDEDLPRLGLPWEGLAEAEALIAKHQASLDAFHDAAKLGGYAAFPPNYDKGALQAYSSWKGIQLASRLLRLELEVHAHRRDVPKVLQTLNTLLLSSRAIENEPCAPAQLTACGCDRYAAQGLAAALFRVEFTKEELVGIQSTLRTKVPTKSMAACLIGERAIQFAMLSDRNLMDPKPPFSPLNSDRAHFLKYMTRHISAMEKGFPECNAERDRIEDQLLEVAQWGQYCRLPWNYSHDLVSIVSAVYRPAADRIINLTAADLAISIEFYRREHGKLPNSLQELVPKFIKEVPNDPYSGAPLVYRRTPEGFKIYGLYWPAIDNGGKFRKGRMDTWDSGIEFPVTQSPEPIEKKTGDARFEQWLLEQE